jgi:hypothetical protein
MADPITDEEPKINAASLRSSRGVSRDFFARPRVEV